MPVLQTRDLKQRAGEILDAAKSEPQFIFRDGQLFMLAAAEPGPGVRNLPEGYFADAYPLDEERQAIEAKSLKVPQSPKR